jgi:glucose/arabinose dehydrogenase
MRASFLWVGGVALPVAVLFACSTDSGAPGSTPIESDGGFDGTTGDDGGGRPDAPPPPPAVGDPCRGTPLPTAQHYVPQGMCARVVATRITGARQIMFAPNGDLVSTSNSGTIRILHDADGNGVFDQTEITTYANTGGNGSNAHIDGGFIYAGTPMGVRRWPYAPGMTSGGMGEDVVAGQPADGNHPLHTTHVYDGYLYVHSGSSGNASDPIAPAYDDGRSLIRRFKLSDFKSGTPFAWASGEVYSQGLRNMVGYTRNLAGRMFGVVNGLDDIQYGGQDVHNDNPGEQMVELGMGKAFGYPFCFTAQRVIANGAVIAPGTQLANPGFAGHDDAWCAQNSSKPATFIQAHSAPLDLAFFETQPQGALPEKYRWGAFVALHGSWDRSPNTGYKVIFVPFDTNGNPPMPTSTMNDTTFPYETVFGGGDTNGPKDGSWSWSANGGGDSPRPSGVAISPIDGALYIATDSGGIIYRIGVQK